MQNQLLRGRSIKYSSKEDCNVLVRTWSMEVRTYFLNVLLRYVGHVPGSSVYFGVLARRFVRVSTYTHALEKIRVYCTVVRYAQP